jgi:hypothetical protein
MRLFLTSLAAFLLMPVMAFADEVAAVVTPAAVPLADDPYKLIEQLAQAAQASNWLLVVPLGLILLVYVFRKLIAPKVPFFATNRGGAVLSLVVAVLTAFLSAVVVPGPHSVMSIIVASVTALVSNQLLFSWINKIVSPEGKDKAEEIAAKMAAQEAKLAKLEAAVQAKETAEATNKALDNLKGMTIP